MSQNQKKSELIISRLPPPSVLEKVEILSPEEYKKDPTLLTIVSSLYAVKW